MTLLSYDLIFSLAHHVVMLPHIAKQCFHRQLSDADTDFRLPSVNELDLSVESVSSPNGPVFLWLIMHVIKDELKD